MPLTIGLLGALEIESDDCRLGKVPKKARALLGFLAAQGGQAVSRERLADLLWPYQGSDQARHSLRNCLLELRKALGPQAGAYLVADFASCRVQDTIVDLDRFERLSRSRHLAELQTAADLYRGEFLADFHIDSEPFQEWLAAERDRTLVLICDILQRLSAAQDAAGEAEAAIQSGRRLVALDPLSEFGQRVLMRAYARAGRRGEALRQYKSCAETLKRELGVAPDAETQGLANEIARAGDGGQEAPGRAASGGGLAAAGGVAARDLPGHAAAVRGEPAIGTRPGTARLQWPCLLSSIAVAVAPLRNLTGDPEQQYLVEAFTDDLVTDLLRCGRGLPLGAVGRPRQPLETVEVDDYLLNAAIGKVGDQMVRRTRPQRLAQLQQTVAQAVSRLLGTLVRPQQIGQPLATDRLPALRRQIAEQRPRLLGHLPEPTIIALDHQNAQHADRQCHRHRPNA